jgi:hypothetical protein
LKDVKVFVGKEFAPTSAVSLMTGRRLKAVKRGGGVIFALPILDHYDIIAIS